MSRPTVATALLVERLALRGLPRVVHTGMGAAKVRRHASRLGSGPLLTAGVAGGVGPAVRPGDLVVASEVVSASGRVPVPSAALLAAAIRSTSGLTVHLGPVWASDTIVKDRRSLAQQGILAVDMESAAFAQAASGAFAVVRAVVDTADHPLLSPGTAWRGAMALRNLRRAVPGMRLWLDATADRQVLLAGPRSFCAGVERAIDIVERALDKYDKPIYVRRQIVHNAHVVRHLTERGAVFVEEVDEVPAGARLVYAAHGVSPAVRAAAEVRGLSVIDATCPLVAKVHTEVRRHSGYGDSVFLIGHRDHEEVQGTLGEAPAHVLVVENAAQAATVEPIDADRVSYVMQTTLAVDEAEEIAEVLRQRFPALSSPRTDDICYATSNRQAAVRQIAADCDLMLVIGSPNSSNSRRLVEVSEREGTPAHLVDDASEIDLRWLAGATRIGVTAGASAPPVLVDELVECLRGLGSVQTRESVAAMEDIRFTLPKEVA